MALLESMRAFQLPDRGEAANDAPQQNAPVVVERVGRDNAAEYDRFVEDRTDATLYHLRAWGTVAERVYGMRAPFLLARGVADGRVHGVLPLFLIERPLTRYLTSGIFGSYGPLLAESATALRALTREALALAEREGAQHLHLKVLGDAALAGPFSRRHIWDIARLSLRGGEEATWQRLPTAMRTKIRKARNSGLVARDGPELFGQFYEVLADNMHRKGSPIYGMQFLRGMLAELGARADIVTLERGGETISAAMTMAFNGVMYVPFASSRASAFALKPNNLLFWEIIRRASAQGLGLLDFGTSMVGASTFDFKLSFKPEVIPVVSHLWSRDGTEPVTDPTGAGVRLLMRAWQLLPRGMADALGPHVIKWAA